MSTAEPARPLDDVDQAIVGLLREDGRATSRAIGAAVGLAETAVTARIRALIAREALAITTVFDWAKVGYRHDLWLKIRSDGDPAPLARTIAGMKGVHAVLRVLDPYDLIVHVLMEDQDDLAGFLSTELAGTPGLVDVETAVTLRVIKYSITLAKVPIETFRFDFPDPQIELDDLDHAMLGALARDGRQSNRQIARDFGVNEGTIRSRIRRLETADLMRIRGQLNPQFAGPSVTRSITSVQTDPATGESIGRLVADLPGITMITMITGRYNLLLVGGYNDQTQMRETLTKVRNLPGVNGIQNSLLTDIVALDYHLARIVDG